MSGTVIIILFAFVIPAVFFIQWLMTKLNIIKPVISRAKIVHKRMWDGPPQAGLWVAPKSIKPDYYITFSFMIDNNWTEADFKVSRKIYDSYAVGNEGILKHNYTDFREFEKFQK